MSEKNIVLEGIGGLKLFNSIATGKKSISVVMLTMKNGDDEKVIPSPVAEAQSLAWDYTLLTSGTGLIHFDDDVSLPEYIYFGLGAQALLWMKAREFNAFPSIHADLAIVHWVTDFTAGYLGKPIPWVDNDGATTTDFTEAVEGLAHTDLDVTPTLPKHWQWTRRFAYTLGRAMSKERKNLTESISATPSLVVRERQILHLAVKGILQLVYLFPMMAAQSEKTAFNIGVLDRDMVREDRLKAILGAPIDPCWRRWVKKYKTDLLDRGSPNVANHCTYVDDMLDFMLTDSEDINLAVSRMKSQYMVPAVSLDIARNLVGICVTSETIQKDNHYAVFFNMVYDDDLKPLHPLRYYVGLQLAAVSNWLHDMNDVVMDLLDNMKRQSHWTWTDEKAKTDIISCLDFMVPYNFIDHLKGLCNPSIVRGLDRALAFTNFGSTDPAWDGTHYAQWQHGFVPLDPVEFDDSGTPIISTDLVDTTADEAPILSMSMLFYTELDEMKQIFLPATWTDQEIYYAIWWELLTFRVDAAADDGKIDAYRMRLTNFIDYENESLEYGFAYATAEELRFGNKLNHRTTANPIWARNYTVRLVNNTLPGNNSWQAARPSPGYTPVTRLINIDDKNAVDSYWAAFWGSDKSVKSDVGSTPKMPEKKAAPVKTPDVANESKPETPKSQGG